MVYRSYARASFILLATFLMVVAALLQLGYRFPWYLWGLMISGFGMVCMVIWDTLPQEWIEITPEFIAGPTGRLKRHQFERQAFDPNRTIRRSWLGRLLGYWDLYSFDGSSVRVNCALLGASQVRLLAKELGVSYPGERWDRWRGPIHGGLFFLVGLGMLFFAGQI